jgi:hypothetical protein
MNISEKASQDIEVYAGQFANAIKQRLTQDNDPNRAVMEAGVKRMQMRQMMAFELFKRFAKDISDPCVPGDQQEKIADMATLAFDQADALLAEGEKRDIQDREALAKRLGASKPPFQPKAVANEPAENSN